MYDRYSPYRINSIQLVSINMNDYQKHSNGPQSPHRESIKKPKIMNNHRPKPPHQATATAGVVTAG